MPGGWVSREALIRLLGEGGAARVVEVFGGKRIYLSAPHAPGFAGIASKIGEEITRALHKGTGGGWIELPRRLVPLVEQIVRLRQEMVTPADIARRLRCAERYVYFVLARQWAHRGRSMLRILRSP